MSLRKVANDGRKGRTAVHYFAEGSEKTLCGKEMHDEFKVKGEGVPMSCRECAAEAARMLRERVS